MKEEKTKRQEYKEVDGFRDWRFFFEFIGEKYADVSVAIIKKDFCMARETMRELIDNSSPYHSNVFRIKSEDEDGKVMFTELEYPDYYEVVVDELDKAIEMEDRPTLAPHEKEILAEAKDNFMKKSRELRRIIMADLSVSGIIPQSVTKKQREVNAALKSD